MPTSFPVFSSVTHFFDKIKRDLLFVLFPGVRDFFANIIASPRKILGWFLLFSPILFACGAPKSLPTTQAAPVEEFAFIEYYITHAGVALQGTPPPGMGIDGPSYYFEKETGLLLSQRALDFDPDTIQLVVGLGMIRKGTEGRGMATRLDGSGELPYQHGDFSIQKLSLQHIRFSLFDQQIDLETGKLWEYKTESTDTIAGMSGPAIIQRSVTHQIHYHGYLLKQNLQ